MSAEGLSGFPGGDAQEAVTVPVSKQTTFSGFLVADPQPLPDGGTQVAFIVPGASEVLIFPLPADAAEKLGRQLLAPRVALPDRAGSNGLRAV